METASHLLFDKSTKRSATIAVALLLIILGSGLLYSCGATAEVVEAPPVRLVMPKIVEDIVPDTADALVDPLPPISVESVVQPPSVIIKTTLVVTHPEREDGNSTPSFDPGEDNVGLIVDLFNNTGCVVIVGEAETFRQRAFIYTIGKTECTLIQVVKTVEEVMPHLPIAGNL